MDPQPDDLTHRIDQIRSAQRRLGRSVDASGIALSHVLAQERSARDEALDHWPRPFARRPRLPPRLGRVLLLSVVALCAVFVLSRWVAQPAAPVAKPPGGERFLVHLRATKPSRVRVIVDGSALAWRSVQEGDEVFARPQQDIEIHADDAGALSATVNGEPISLGLEGEPTVFRFSAGELLPSRPQS